MGLPNGTSIRTKFGFLRSPQIISLRPTFESEWVRLRDLRRRWDDDVSLLLVVVLILFPILMLLLLPVVEECEELVDDSPSFVNVRL